MKKASERIKKKIPIDEIHKRIDELEKNFPYQNKIFIPHFEQVSDQAKLVLVNFGYKVYQGDRDGVVKDCLIIEW